MSVSPEYLEQLVLDEIAGVITPEDSATLKNILAQDPEALAIRNDLYAEYGNNPVLDRLPETLTVDMVWERVREKKRRRMLTVLSIAASVLVLLGAYLLFAPAGSEHAMAAVSREVTLEMPDGEVVQLGAAVQQVGNVVLRNDSNRLSYTGGEGRASLVVPAGKEYTIILADGSTVQLNAGSKMTFPMAFDDISREIRINGEAYVKVAKDAARPFIVHVANGAIEVLGTEFNVNTYGKVTVSLVSGAVRMRTGDDSLLLHPGFAVCYNPGTKLTEAPFEAEDVLAWRSGVFLFSDTTLTALAGLISRWYGVEVVNDTPAAGDRRFSGAMDRNKPITSFLEGLKFMGRLEYYFDKDSVLHLK
ncbi:FecR family protein [Chitinophaga sancti]|uniref:FecR domain-containing protein n=1 Tax=Chitinophaga sancti TaxID=1004 RepID=A0A1K1S330_9BACT|nr:FecR domain-containing protein [Chitinophaga sancti]WQD59645.1 FecR domain-containing protein [Chitinophaga sancti]WQG88224.1 FecR domain-containing protein [Chitinophaga sancti]SFW78500.1 FecR family protein [Chitinophaga sancti]